LLKLSSPRTLIDSSLRYIIVQSPNLSKVSLVSKIPRCNIPSVVGLKAHLYQFPILDDSKRT
jgi:hypothetical protein